MDLWCKRNDTEEDPYEYCAAFSFLINFSTHVYVTQQPRLIMNFTLSKMDLSFGKVIESKVGNFSFTSLNNLFYFVVDNLISAAINAYLIDGLDINWLIQEVIGLTFINLREL